MLAGDTEGRVGDGMRGLAARLGLDKDTVARALRRLRDAALVELIPSGGYRIRVHDCDGVSVARGSDDDRDSGQQRDTGSRPVTGDSGRGSEEVVGAASQAPEVPAPCGRGPTPREPQPGASPTPSLGHRRRAKRNRSVAESQPRLFDDTHAADSNAVDASSSRHDGRR